MKEEHWRALMTIPVQLNDDGTLESPDGEITVSKDRAQIYKTLLRKQLIAIAAWMEDENAAPRAEVRG